MDRPKAPRSAGHCFRPDGELWNLPFLREVAGLLAYAPRGCALWLEDLPGPERLQLRPFDRSTEELLYRAARGVPGMLGATQIVPNFPADLARTSVGFLSPTESLTPDPRAGLRASPPCGLGAGAHRAPKGVAGVPEPGEPEATGPSAAEGRSAIRTLWASTGLGTLRVIIEFWCSEGPDGAGVETARGFGARLRRRLAASGIPATSVRLRRARPSDRRRWIDGRRRRFGAGNPFVLEPATAAGAAIAARDPPFPSREVVRHHLALAGASGSGKSALLTRLAAHAIAQGIPTLAFDVHGDLFPGILGSLAPGVQPRLVALDPARPGRESIGISVLDAQEAADRPRLAAQSVAALRRLSSDGGEVYWGFRLERIFDTFVRLVQEERGDLLDLYELLTEERRREASRLATRDPTAARFLEELPAILKRNPEFLWPAAARLAKIVQDPRLGRLLAPRSGSVDVDALLASGRSLLVRLPIGEFGPEGAGFAVSLLAGRAYLGLSRTLVDGTSPPRAVLVVDEAHLLAPRLLAEILSDGRKFGVAVFLATQYPERLAPDVQEAIRGAVGTHLLFRVPRASADVLGRWAGLSAESAGTLLPALPPGMAIVSSHGDAGVRRSIRFDPPPPPDPVAWDRAACSSLREFALAGPEDAPEIPALDEALLLSAFAIECEGRAATVGGVLARTFSAFSTPAELETGRAQLTRLVDRGWVEDVGVEIRLTRAGRRYLGYGGTSGAATESAQHRALLLEAFRVFARKGHRIDILRQGRFDTRLPDAVYRQVLLPPGPSPWEIARAVDRARSGWAWRFFRQRDVHLEAEVSGALRPERIRNGIRKAAARDAYLLVLVGDARRAERVRSVLRTQQLDRTRAQVWTLRPRLGTELLPGDGPLTSAPR